MLFALLRPAALLCGPGTDKTLQGVRGGAQLMAEEKGKSVDMDGFEACMAEQRERSRAAGKAGTGPSLKFEAEATAHLQRSGVPVTDDSPKCVPALPAGPHLHALWSASAVLPGPAFMSEPH